MVRLLVALAFAGVLGVVVLGIVAPARATPPVEDYGKLPAMEMVTLSPSGNRYAFVADDGRARRLFILTADNKPLKIVNIGVSKLKVRDVEWAGDDFVVVYVSATIGLGAGWSVDKSELWSAVAIDVKTGKETMVFANNRSVEHAVFGFHGIRRVDGRWYGYFAGHSLDFNYLTTTESHYANTYNEGQFEWIISDLYRVDLETGDLRLMAKGQGQNATWLVGADGEVAARTFYNEVTGDWKVSSGGFGGRTLAVGRSKFGGADLIGFGRAGDSIIVSYASDQGPVVQDLPLSGAPGKTVLDPWSVESLITDPMTQRWIGTTAKGDEVSDSFFEPAFEARVRGARKAFPGYLARLVSWSADFNRMVMFTEGGDDSGTYWIVDIAKKSADPLGEAYPTVRPADVGPVRMVDWKAADGLAMRGVLTLPPGGAAKGLPLVVMPHGGPQERDYPGFDFWAQAFASRGYAVFQPNFRGSAGYGQKFRDAGFGEWGRKMQTDISDGVAELAREGIVDPKRACIVGASYGGYAALAGVTVQHGLYRWAVSLSGVADLAAMLNYVGDESGSASGDTRYWKDFLGVKSSWGVLNEISPVKLADRADAPILLIHGDRDTVVPIDQSDRMEQALKAAGKPVERITVKGADHWRSRQDERLEELKASVAFVERYDPPDPPAKTAVASGPSGP